MPAEKNPPLLNEEVLRHIALWAVVCAERALPLFEAKAPDDTRPRHIVQRMPARAPSKAQFHALLYRLDAGLRQ
ncbi:putative immunity protein [Ensifer canadensis]